MLLRGERERTPRNILESSKVGIEETSVPHLAPQAPGTSWLQRRVINLVSTNIKLIHEICILEQ